MSDLERIKREAKERREDCVSFGGLTREHYDSAEAAVDQLLAIAKSWEGRFTALVEQHDTRAEERDKALVAGADLMRRFTELAEREQKALAAARSLRKRVLHVQPKNPVFHDSFDVERLLADTAWVEEA